GGRGAAAPRRGRGRGQVGNGPRKTRGKSRRAGTPPGAKTEEPASSQPPCRRTRDAASWPGRSSRRQRIEQDAFTSPMPSAYSSDRLTPPTEGTRVGAHRRVPRSPPCLARWLHTPQLGRVLVSEVCRVLLY